MFIVPSGCTSARPESEELKHAGEVLNCKRRESRVCLVFVWRVLYGYATVVYDDKYDE